MRVRVGLGIAIGAAGALCAPVEAACLVTAQSVNFGRFNPVLEQTRDGVGRIVISCDVVSQGQVSISTGLAGTFDRAMAAPSGTLNYNLFTTAARTTIWGDGTAGTSRVPFSGTSVQLIIYGRIRPVGQVPAGTFSDVLIATIEY